MGDEPFCVLLIPGPGGEWIGDINAGGHAVWLTFDLEFRGKRLGKAQYRTLNDFSGLSMVEEIKEFYLIEVIEIVNVIEKKVFPTGLRRQ